MRGMIVAWSGVVIAGLLVFVDAPLLTLGQKFRAERRSERLVLMSIELNLILLWAMSRWFFGLDRPLVPAKAALAAGVFGLIVTAAGVALAAAAKVRLGRWFSATLAIKDGHRLITAWPYSWLRHPIYLGLVISGVGTALVLNSALTVLLVALLVVPLWFHTVFEEHLLEQHFGAEFGDYRDRVPRLVPFYGMRTTRAPRTPNGVSSRTR